MRRSLPVLLLMALAVGCAPSVPQPGTEAYLEASGAFYSGVGAMQIGDDLRARARLERVTEIVPGEASAWANLSLLALRRGEISQAVEAADRVLEQGNPNPGVAYIAALAYLAAGDSTRSSGILEASPGHLKSLVLLSEIRGGSGDHPGAVGALETATALASDNAALALRRARALARSGDPASGQDLAGSPLLTNRPHPDPAVLESALAAVRNALPPDLERALARLETVLVRADWYRRDLDALTAPPELVADPIPVPSALQPVRAAASPADRTLILERNPLPVPAGGWTWAGGVHLREDPLPSVLLARPGELHLPDGEVVSLPEWAAPDRSPDDTRLGTIVAQDLDQDYLTDLVIAGSGGIAVLFQSDGSFVERAGVVPPLPAVSAVLVADFDMEGDLDLIVGLTDGPAAVLTNRGDGTFERGPELPVEHLRRAVWADVDGDGDPDLVTLTEAGLLAFHRNLRNGRWAPPVAISDDIQGVSLDDADRDGTFELAVLESARPRRYSLAGGVPSAVDIDLAPAGSSAAFEPQRPRSPTGLVLTELDNNGALDWVIRDAEGLSVWLADDQDGLIPAASLPLYLEDVAPLTAEGPPELIGLEEGSPVVYFPVGDAGYQWKRIRPRAADVQGDRRINTFAVGGEVELRSGLLFQKRPITGRVLHFGLGDNLLTEVARIAWPNGDVQIEFDLLSDETVLAEQRLKGSCPWVFTDDGSGFRFVTDFLWRSPLGLRINAQETAGIATTSDWIRIPGDALAARDGFHEIRITAELWESHFFDHVALMAVDHPASTEAFVDERFAFPPPDDRVFLVDRTRPFERVVDAAGNAADDAAANRDGTYVAGFELGAYQGIAEEHAVELLLPGDAPAEVLLVGFGWVRPTDSSINVAIGQGSTDVPVSLQLEIPDDEGNWVTVRSDLGFPSGKQKTVLIDLAGLWEGDDVRRFRLRTNLEIYWDQLHWAPVLDAPLRTVTLKPEHAELRYRGFSEVTAADSVSPEIPDYSVLAASHPVWRDLVGYHTRFGDVRELLDEVDDRYVIMNAGDEMVLRFPAPPPPEDGWTRDFVLLGDGWVKDGDLNTTFSTTVLPLPTHASTAYETPPAGLEQDPVYRRHASDWEHFHTRYVTPDRYHRALRAPRQGTR